MSDTTEPSEDEEIVGRCYTKARATPLVTGKIHGPQGRAFRLPFGPYTTTQIAAFVVGVAGMTVTRRVWGSDSWADVLPVLVVPFVLAVALRRLHVDGRNPAAAALSAVMLLAAPRHGRYQGRPVKAARPVRTSARCRITYAPTPPSPPLRTEPAVAVRRHPSTATTSPRPTAVAVTRPPAETAPVASGVQALLAKRAS